MADVDTAEARGYWKRQAISGPQLDAAFALIDALDTARANLAMPCGSCHPCMNWRDETWRRADRKPPHVHEWDEATERIAAVADVLDGCDETKTAMVSIVAVRRALTLATTP